MKRRFTVFNLMGVILIFALLRVGFLEVKQYWTDWTRRDWPETTAVVTAVDSWQERVSSGTRKNRRTRYVTLYNATYMYQVDGVTYAEHIQRSRTSYTQDAEISVKYDPAAHGSSTVVQPFSLYNLVVGWCIWLLFAVIGYFTSGLWAWRRRRRGREDDAPEPPGI